jgi:hypothetical protein
MRTGKAEEIMRPIPPEGTTHIATRTGKAKEIMRPVPPEGTTHIATRTGKAKEIMRPIQPEGTTHIATRMGRAKLIVFLITVGKSRFRAIVVARATQSGFQRGSACEPFCLCGALVLSHFLWNRTDPMTFTVC